MQSQALQPTLVPISPESNAEVGQTFEDARIEKGISLDDASEALHIRKIFLVAIEKGQFSALPGNIYIFGFMKKYAEFLELDFSELQRRLHFTVEECVPLSSQDFVSSYETPRHRKYIWMSLLLTLATGGGFYWNSLAIPSLSEHRAVLPPPIESTALEASALAVDTVAPSAFPSVESIPSYLQTSASSEQVLEFMPVAAVTSAHSVDKSVSLVLRASQPTWIEVRGSDGAKIVTRILEAGERYTIPQRKGLILNIGNAGGVEIIKNDIILPSLGRVGQVRKDISLDSYLEPN